MPFFLSRGGRCNRRRSGPIQAPPRASSSTAAASTEDHHHLADTCTTADSAHLPPPHHHHPHHHQMSMSMPMVVPLHGQWDAVQADDASHKRQRQTSWCSTAGASEPIDIPPHSQSPKDGHLFGELQTITTALTGGDDYNSHTNNNDSSMNGYSSAPCRPDASGGEVGCWSASWYRSEPWKNSEALDSGTPEKPPAHIMIWEERTARSASQAAAAMAAREGMGRRALEDADDEDDDDDLRSRGDTSSEDSIFEMDM